MTNIIATVIAVLATNWVTVSRTTPVVPNEALLYAVMRYDTLNQTGTVVTNYMARIVWNGKTNEFVLESVTAANRKPETRSISVLPYAPFLTNP